MSNPRPKGTRVGGQFAPTQLVRQLPEPRPRDARTTTELARYKELDTSWSTWSDVVGYCTRLALEIARVR